jgi:hypothetical protein
MNLYRLILNYVFLTSYFKNTAHTKLYKNHDLIEIYFVPSLVLLFICVGIFELGGAMRFFYMSKRLNNYIPLVRGAAPIHLDS